MQRKVGKVGKIGTVFYSSVIILTIFVIWGAVFPNNLAESTGNAFSFMLTGFGWFYLLATVIFLAFSIFLAVGPFRKIKLGQPDEKPEYSYFSWIAMLFSAGMGIGLVYWGVAEPMFHYLSPPEGAAGGTVEAARLSMQYSFFHWGFHPWAIYTVVALALAYTQFRRLDKGLISSTFRPLIGDRVEGPIGKSIDSLASIATVFGVATSLGLGAMQINGGLDYLMGIPQNEGIQLLIILIITMLFVASTLTGLNKGILYLSNLNMILAAALIAFVLFAGPTMYIVDVFTQSIGAYVGNIIPMSFTLYPFSGDGFAGAWTLFYWAWWIAWAPFVGTFIARVSRGRSIQEFVLGVLLIPTVLGAFWFAVFGGIALNLEAAGAGIADAVGADMNSALFIMFNELPFGAIISVLAVLLVVTFFVTSADSATYVLGTLTSDGDLNPKLSTRLIWGVLQAGVAAVLLFSEGLGGLQTASFIAALPFTVIMLFMVWATYRSLNGEVKEMKRKEKLHADKIKELINQAEQEGKIKN